MGRTPGKTEEGVVVLYWISVALLCIAVTCVLCYVLYKAICLFLAFRKLTGFKKRGLSHFLRYQFENWFSETDHSNFKVVMIAAFLILCFGAPMYSLVRNTNIFMSIWKVFSFLVDPGAAVGMRTDGSRLHRILEMVFSALMAICGLIIFALLLMMMGDSFNNYQQWVNEGHSDVMESGHVVLLGFPDSIVTLIEELCNAHEDAGGTTIVVLDDKFSKAEMEQRIQEFQDSEINVGASRIVVRCGKPHHAPSLRKVGAHTAGTVIVLPDDAEAKEVRDSFALRTLGTLRSKGWPVDGQIVVQCSLFKNFDLFERIGGDVTNTVMPDFFLARLMVQCSKNSGLSTAFNHVLGFEGSEFYIEKVPKHLSGIGFSQALAYYPSAVPVAILSEDACHLCPGHNYTLTEGEEIVLFAENRSKAFAEEIPRVPIDHDAELVTQAVDHKHTRREPETVVIIGWNEIAGATVYQLDLQVASGSRLHLLEEASTKIKAKDDIDKTGPRINQRLEHFTEIHVHAGQLGSRYAIEELSGPIEEASRILLFSDMNAKSNEHADALTITTVLHIHQLILNKEMSRDIAIIPEIRDPLSKITCENFKIQDFVDSAEIPSQILATIAYQPDILSVLSTIVSPDSQGSFSVVRLSQYVKEGPMKKDLSFYEVSAIVGASGDVAVGWSKPYHQTLEAKHESKSWQGTSNKEFHREMSRVVKAAQMKSRLLEYDLNPADKFAEREWSWEEDRVVVITASEVLHSSHDPGFRSPKASSKASAKDRFLIQGRRRSQLLTTSEV